VIQASQIPVIVVDDQNYVGTILERWLRHQPDLRFAGWLPTPERLEARLRSEQEGSRIVVVADYDIPGYVVPQVIARLRENHPSVRVVVFSGDVEHESEVLEVGAAACICKDAGADELLRAIRAAAS
jgi:DNA-binding NarL/FixJ family response regulator